MWCYLKHTTKGATKESCEFGGTNYPGFNRNPTIMTVGQNLEKNKTLRIY